MLHIIKEVEKRRPRYPCCIRQPYDIQFSKVGAIIIDSAMKAYRAGNYKAMEACMVQLDDLDFFTYEDILWGE